MKKSKVRVMVQAFFFILIALISVNHNLVESGGGIALFSNASLHAVCPFGGVVTLYQLFTLGTFVQKLHSSSVILMGIVFLLAVLLGPVFCGWICPFGTFQEWIGKIGKKIFKKKYNNMVPKKLDSKLRYFRIIFLVWVVFMTARSGTIVFSNIDPYYALFNFWTSEVAITGIVALFIIMGLSLFIERPWCKYACPYGAVLGFFNKFHLFKIKRNEATCISCDLCTNNCPMNIEVAKVSEIKDLQCIRCFECTSENSCPVPETVVIETQMIGTKK